MLGPAQKLAEEGILNAQIGTELGACKKNLLHAVLRVVSFYIIGALEAEVSEE